MKRFLIFAVVLSAAVVFGSKFYYEHEMKKALDQMAQSMKVVGDFSYSGVTVTASGDAQINGVRFKPQGLQSEVTIDQIALHTGNALGLMQLQRELKQQQIPVQLGISIHGIRMLTGGDLYRKSESSSVVTQFEAAGCGDRKHITGYDLMDMGYNELMMDVDTDYVLLRDGQQLKLTSQVTTAEMAKVKIVADIQLGAASRDARALGAAISTAQLNGIDIHYEDAGYANKLIDFCADQTQMSRSDYLVHHHTAWIDQWKKLAVQPGPNLSGAYENFIREPKEFRVYLYPYTKLSMLELFASPANILIYQLQGTVDVNNEASKKLDLAGLTDEEMAEYIAATDPSANTAENVQAVFIDPNILALDKLSQHLQVPVSIKLANGKSYKGQILAIEEERMRFQRFINNGNLIMPVQLADLTEVRLETE